MKATRPAPAAPRMRPMLRVLAATTLGIASAQSAPQTSTAPPVLDFRMDLSAPAVRESRVLPRVFYSPAARRDLEIAEANALSDADSGSKNGPAAAVRFNGWLSGPGPTRAWINGTAHVASGRDGAITPIGNPPDGHANGKNEEQSVESTARFDAASQQLVIVSARGMERRLRAGQSEDQDSLRPLTASAPPAAAVTPSDAPADAPGAEDHP